MARSTRLGTESGADRPDDVTDLHDLHRSTGGDGLDSAGNDRAPEPPPARLGQPTPDPGDAADLACQANLAESDKAGWQGDISLRAGQRDCQREVNGRLGQPDAADRGGVEVAPAKVDLGPPVAGGDGHAHSRTVETRRHPAGRLAAAY